MVLLGLALALVAPEVSAWIGGLRVRAAADSILAGAERARMEAVKRNSNVSIWLVNDPSSSVPGASCALSGASAAWVVSVNNPAGHCQATPSETESPRLAYRSEALANAQGLLIAAVTPNGDVATSLTFNGLGQVVDADNGIARIDVSATDGQGRPLRLQVGAGGAMRMCDANVDVNDPRACGAG